MVARLRAALEQPYSQCSGGGNYSNALAPDQWVSSLRWYHTPLALFFAKLPRVLETMITLPHSALRRRGINALVTKTLDVRRQSKPSAQFFLISVGSSELGNVIAPALLIRTKSFLSILLFAV